MTHTPVFNYSAGVVGVFRHVALRTSLGHLEVGRRPLMSAYSTSFSPSESGYRRPTAKSIVTHYPDELISNSIDDV